MIDLLLGGSPCQGFSFAGKQLNFFDPRSKLFFDYVKALEELKPKYFLLENVKMKQEYQDVISKCLGVEPIEINSSLVSAQNRVRLYWTNIPGIQQPKDKGITWGDVREHGVEWSPMYYSDKAMEWIGKHGTRKGKKLKIHEDCKKMQMLEASHFKKYSSQRFFGIVDQPSAIKGRYIEMPSQIMGRKLNEEGHREDYNPQIKPTQCLEVRGGDKINCLTTVRKDTVISPLPKGRYPDVFNQLEEGKHYRYITVLECERLQTLPDGYTAGISDTQRYKALGNGWTADVIAHILSFIPETNLQTVVSLFDGISCGQIALERAGKVYNQYYASEIDKYAIQVAMKNYPHTMQLGDVTKIDWKQFLDMVNIIQKVS